MENIFTEGSIPRYLFSPTKFIEHIKSEYGMTIINKTFESENCYFVNTNSRKIGKDFWKIIELYKILMTNNIEVTVYYSKEVFTIEIPDHIHKEEIQKYL